MKKVFLAFLAASALFLQGCEGPAGRDGIDGQTIKAEVIEVKGSFNDSNGYLQDYDIKPSIGVDDKVIGFILEGKDNLGNDNWEPLPQTLFENGNTYLFSFNFSRAGFTIFMDGNGSLNQFPVAKRTDRWFRIVIVPGTLVSGTNLNSMKDIMGKLNINDGDVKRDTPVLLN